MMTHRLRPHDQRARRELPNASQSPDTRPPRDAVITADIPKRRRPSSPSASRHSSSRGRARDVDRSSSPPPRRTRSSEPPSLPHTRSSAPTKLDGRRESDKRSKTPPRRRRDDRSARSPAIGRPTDSDTSQSPSRGRRDSDIWRRRRDRSPSPPPRRRRSRSRSPSRRNRLHSRSRSPPIRKRRRSRSPSRSPARRSRRPLPSQESSFRSDRRAHDNGDNTLDRPVEKQKPNYNTTGLLARESNTVAGTKVVLKYHEPPDARKPPPSQQWRLYVFKGEDVVQTVLLYTRSCWLIGREAAVADVLVEHPSASGQHAVVQFRHKKKKKKVQSEEETREVDVVRPYVMDLESANGTELNGQKIEQARYVEIKNKDIVKIGGSEREYVFVLPPNE